jgi:hypothetical protein
VKSAFVERNSREWDLLWEHLIRVLPETNYADNFAGETWEYMGTYYSSLATHDNRGTPIADHERCECWNHQFRHRNFKGWGRMYVNIVADFESIPHAVEAAELGVEL